MGHWMSATTTLLFFYCKYRSPSINLLFLLCKLPNSHAKRIVHYTTMCAHDLAMVIINLWPPLFYLYLHWIILKQISRHINLLWIGQFLTSYYLPFKNFILLYWTNLEEISRCWPSFFLFFLFLFGAGT